MQLKFKLTDTATGQNWVTDWALNSGGDVLSIINGETINYDDEDITRSIPRLFTGLHDAAGNEIYEGDVLGSFDAFDILPLRVGYDFGRFQLFNADATSQCDLPNQPKSPFLQVGDERLTHLLDVC